jgi:glycerophosphoryl diester phosphodiesterase
MAIQTINVGTAANDGTGDDLRSGAIKINENFAEIDAAVTAFESLTIDDSPALASADRLVPIIPAASGLPSIDAQTLLLTVPNDTILMDRGIPYITNGSSNTLSLSSGSSTKIVYYDKSSRTLIRKAYNTGLTNTEKSNFLTIGTFRISNGVVSGSVSCGFTIRNGNTTYGNEHSATDMAAIYPPRLDPNPDPHLPIYDSVANTLTLTPDTVLTYGNDQLVLTQGSVISLNTQSSATRVFWNRVTGTFVTNTWNTVLTTPQLQNYVLVATIRKVGDLSPLNTINMSSPYTMNGRIFGYVETQPENRPDATIRGIGHRGYATVAPENTIPSLVACVRNNTFNLEGDIQWTSDNVPVLFHDSSVNRTTNGTGTVNSFTLAQLKALDAGSWFDAEFADTRVPTLAEALSFAKTHNCFFYLEAKDTITTAQAQIIYDEIRAAGMIDHVEVDSFSTASLLELAATGPDLNLGYIIGSVTTTNIDFVVNNLKNGTRGVSIVCSQGGLTTQNVRDVRLAGIYIVIWTITDDDELSTAISLNPDGIMTSGLNVAAALQKILDAS